MSSLHGLAFSKQFIRDLLASVARLMMREFVGCMMQQSDEIVFLLAVIPSELVLYG